jgi:hypothetical protein
MTPMKKLAAAACVLLTSCVTAPTAARAPGISPADLVASIADVAAGRNAAMREAGIYLESIKFNLLVGTEEQVGGKVQIIVLDAEASRKAESSFLQTFTLEVPPAPPKGVRPAVAGLPEVKAFVETAMETARDLALAAKREGLPQQLKSVELVAKLTVSRKIGGGIGFTVPTVTTVAASAGASRAVEEANTVTLIFQRVGP